MQRWLAERGLGEEVLRANRVGADPGPAALDRPRGLPRGGPAVVLPVLGAGRGGRLSPEPLPQPQRPQVRQPVRGAGRQPAPSRRGAPAPAARRSRPGRGQRGHTRRPGGGPGRLPGRRGARRRGAGRADRGRPGRALPDRAPGRGLRRRRAGPGRGRAPPGAAGRAGRRRPGQPPGGAGGGRGSERLAAAGRAELRRAAGPGDCDTNDDDNRNGAINGSRPVPPTRPRPCAGGGRARPGARAGAGALGAAPCGPGRVRSNHGRGGHGHRYLIRLCTSPSAGEATPRAARSWHPSHEGRLASTAMVFAKPRRRPPGVRRLSGPSPTCSTGWKPSATSTSWSTTRSWRRRVWRAVEQATALLDNGDRGEDRQRRRPASPPPDGRLAAGAGDGRARRAAGGPGLPARARRRSLPGPAQSRHHRIDGTGMVGRSRAQRGDGTGPSRRRT